MVDWLQEGSSMARMTRSSLIGVEFCERERILGREKKRKEKGKRGEREKKEVFGSFGFSKSEFILFSIFQSNISFLRISIRIFNI